MFVGVPTFLELIRKINVCGFLARKLSLFQILNTDLQSDHRGDTLSLGRCLLSFFEPP
ncbi:hypothetical protein LEP1GSC053_1949 [Leptospira interrogans serovar Muenchen str. Brem 129]|nr:hypothetical protein LEP1GSC053_1949 [Leptospira interrogans serovar Muenchen str. Brem 129]